MNLFFYASLWFQDPSCTSRETLYCEIFVMTQCSVSMTLAHVIEYGERKWTDICENQFNQLSAGNLDIILSSIESGKIRLKLL